MGYQTDFTGTLTVTPPLNEDERSYLQDFADTRHTSTEHGPLVVDPDNKLHIGGNTPQAQKPEIWSNWVADEAGNLTWSGAEKTYAHDHWLRWIIGHLFGPDSYDFVHAHLDDDPRLKRFTHNHVISGDMEAVGEEPGDRWRIHVTNNNVEVQYGRTVYGS